MFKWVAEKQKQTTQILESSSGVIQKRNDVSLERNKEDQDVADRLLFAFREMLDLLLERSSTKDRWSGNPIKIETTVWEAKESSQCCSDTLTMNALPCHFHVCCLFESKQFTKNLLSLHFLLPKDHRTTETSHPQNTHAKDFEDFGVELSNFPPATSQIVCKISELSGQSHNNKMLLFGDKRFGLATRVRQIVCGASATNVEHRKTQTESANWLPIRWQDVLIVRENFSPSKKCLALSLCWVWQSPGATKKKKISLTVSGYDIDIRQSSKKLHGLEWNRTDWCGAGCCHGWSICCGLCFNQCFVPMSEGQESLERI